MEWHQTPNGIEVGDVAIMRRKPAKTASFLVMYLNKRDRIILRERVTTCDLDYLFPE